MRNTHKTIAESLVLYRKFLKSQTRAIKKWLPICLWVLDPYGDPWNVEIVGEWTENLSSMGSRFSLSDTVGSSTPEMMISYLFNSTIS
jgi:hydroxymethylglutaryl-CoA lyase